MSTRWMLLALVAYLLPTTALARAEAIEAPRVMPTIRGAHITIEHAALEVRCTPGEAGPRCQLHFRCDVVADHLEREGGAFVTIDHASDEQVWIDGAARAHLMLTPGRRVALAIRTVEELTERPFDSMLVGDALWMRHLLLSARSPRMSGHREPRALSWSPFDPVLGQTPSITTTLHDTSGRIEVASSPSGVVMLRATRRETLEDVIRVGGPFLAAGARFEGEDASWFSMRAGYELGLHDWVIVSAAIETDFQRVASLSVMAELVSPAFFVLIFGMPGLSAGIGAVMELGDRGVRGALRISAGAQIMPAGVVATFDFQPDDQSWTLTAMGRASL